MRQHVIVSMDMGFWLWHTVRDWAGLGQAVSRTRRLRKSKFARPYMALKTAFSLVTLPSTAPLFPVSVSPFCPQTRGKLRVRRTRESLFCHAHPSYDTVSLPGLGIRRCVAAV